MIVARARGVLRNDRLGGDVARARRPRQGACDELAGCRLDLQRSNAISRRPVCDVYGQMSNESFRRFRGCSTSTADVLGFLVAAVGPQEAEDCFQETFLAALRAYPRLEDDRNLRGWLLTIAHRKAIDHHRARGRRAVPAGSPEEVAEGKPNPNSRPDAVVGGGRPRALDRCQRSPTQAAKRRGPALRHQDVPTRGSRGRSTARRPPRAATSTKDSRS